MKKSTKRKLKENQWVCYLIISVIAAMYIYGMAGHYFPDPIHLGAGQYVDIAAGVTIIGLLLTAVVITIVFKKRKKKIGAGEYTTLKRN